jgi:hypothetical protein
MAQEEALAGLQLGGWCSGARGGLGRRRHDQVSESQETVKREVDCDSAVYGIVQSNQAQSKSEESGILLRLNAYSAPLSDGAKWLL